MADMEKIIKYVPIDLFHKQGYFATNTNDIANGSGIPQSQYLLSLSK